MNVFYAMFLKEMGAGRRYKAIPAEFFAKYEGVLPRGLLEFWVEEGWSSYADGLFWTVDPEEYSWVAEAWVSTCPSVPQSDFHVFARNAYGEFYCLSADAGCVITISCPTGLLVASKNLLKPRRDSELAAQTFFATGSRIKFDLVDSTDTPLFPSALMKYGQVGANEVYGFIPLLTLGGDSNIENIERVRMDVHLDILRASMEPVLELL